MSDIAVQMGQRIRQLRSDRQMSQEELAFKAGISPAHLGQIERATKNPTIDTISRIASALSVPITELFSDDNAPVTSPNATIEKINIYLEKMTEDQQRDLLRIVRIFTKYSKRYSPYPESEKD